MPLQVTCRKCGYVIEERNENNFDYFDPYNLPKTCPNCGRTLGNIKTAQVKVSPFDTKLKTNSERKAYGKIHRYVFSACMDRRMVVYCQRCGKRIRVGDRVVSVRSTKSRRLRYHEECYEKTARRKVFPFVFGRK